MDSAAATVPAHQVLLDGGIEGKQPIGGESVRCDGKMVKEERECAVEEHIDKNGDSEVSERNGEMSLQNVTCDTVSIEGKGISNKDSESSSEVEHSSHNGESVTECGSKQNCDPENELEGYHPVPKEIISETGSFLAAERLTNDAFINKDVNCPVANGGLVDTSTTEINDELAHMEYSEENNTWVTEKEEESLNESVVEIAQPIDIKPPPETDGEPKVGADNALLIIEDTDEPPQPIPAEVHKLELHISESDLLEKDSEPTDPLTIETTDTRGENNEVYSCQSSPGYIKSPSARSDIVKQNSLDTQITSDDESDTVRSKRGSLHSPSSKIITKLTPITWDQWMKRPASYIPPAKPSPTSSEPPTIVVDAAPDEPKTAPVGESPKVKKTRFQIIPQTSDVLDTNRDDSPKTLETFDETEEDQFLMENPNVLLESHLNELTMVETQLKKLGAAAKAGSKKLAQKSEADAKGMKRTSSADEKGKGWLGWLTMFTKRPTPPSPPPKKQQPRRRQQQQRPRRLDAPPLLPDYSKIPIIIEVSHSDCMFVCVIRSC